VNIAWVGKTFESKDTPGKVIQVVRWVDSEAKYATVDMHSGLNRKVKHETLREHYRLIR
jgi:hypothetical protein